MHWQLGAALEWRTVKYGVSLGQAFAELVDLRTKERARGMTAIGIALNPDPERSDDGLIDYQPMQDRPTSIPLGTPCLGVIPADDWKTFRPVVDGEGRPTSNLEYASSRVPAWARVEFDYQSTMEAWLAVIRGPGQPATDAEIDDWMRANAATHVKRDLIVDACHTQLNVTVARAREGFKRLPADKKLGRGKKPPR